jgi:hypothetical protein
MTDVNTPPADADKGKQPDSGAGAPAAPLQLPEKFKGQTPEQIAKAYVELEKKMGEQSTTVEEAKKLKEQTDTLIKAIWNDPDLYRQVEDGVKKYINGESLPSRDANPKKGDEPPKGVQVDPTISDLRVSEENRVLNDFFAKYGYNKLDEKTRKDSYAKLSLAVAELVDPNGKKSIRDVFASIPVSKLSRYLEHAHFIANKDSIIEQAKNSARLSEQENRDGAIGSFAASSGKSDSGVKLTNREREVAQKMGISEENYLKRKIEKMKDDEKYS